MPRGGTLDFSTFHLGWTLGLARKEACCPITKEPELIAAFSPLWDSYSGSVLPAWEEMAVGSAECDCGVLRKGGEGLGWGVS